MTKPICELCEEGPAVVYVSVTTLDGEVLSRDAVCRDCLKDLERTGITPGRVPEIANDE